jgi:uncharacterized protein
MIVSVKVKPRSSKNTVTLIQGQLVVAVTQPAIDGKATQATLELIAKHFGVSKSRARLVSGKTSRFKKIEII